MHFYLKEPKTDKESIVILQFYVKGENSIFKYSTGEKIRPADWDFKNRIPKTRKGAAGVRLKKTTSYIMRYDNLLETVIDNFKLNDIPLTKSALKEGFDRHFKRHRASGASFEHLSDFVDDFIDRAPGLTNRKTKKRYTSAKVTEYKVTLNRLKDFEKHRKAKIKMAGFSLSVYDEAVNFLSDQRGYSLNSIGAFIKNIKVFSRKAEEFGHRVHADYKKSEFAVLKEESPSIALGESEIQRLFEHDFSADPELENCRDLAIIGLWTGLRISDLLDLPTINASDRFITVQPKKTKDSSGVKVVIPLHHQIKGVLSRRGIPVSISEHKFNLSIKKACKTVGITDRLKGSLMNPKTRRKEVGMYAKYRLVSSHTCRRSFATNLYKMNFPTLSIMKITGHTSERSFLSYIKVTPTEHAEKLLDHWNDYYSGKGQVSSSRLSD